MPCLRDMPPLESTPVKQLRDMPPLGTVDTPKRTLPTLPNEIVMDIIRQADGGRYAHGIKLKQCLKQMKKVFTVDLECVETGETKEGWVSNCFNPLIEGEKRFEYPNLYTPFTNTALKKSIDKEVADNDGDEEIRWIMVDSHDHRRHGVWRPPEVDELHENEDWFGVRYGLPEIFEC